MTYIFAPSYLTRRPTELALRKFAASLPARVVVYDVGCGEKPYASFFKKHLYTGVDTNLKSSADITYVDGALIPLPTASADAIICTETLQHSHNPQQIVDEIYRLLKPGGAALITVPFGIKMLANPRPSSHSATTVWRDDYWRFTKYGLLRLTKQFKVISLVETTGYISALLQLINYGLASMNLGLMARPLYFVNNIVGFLSDSFMRCLTNCVPGGQRFYELIYTSFTTNYIVMVRKT